MITLLWGLVLLLVTAPPAAGQGDGWTITSFDADYTIQTDGSIAVIERLTADFGALHQHGIYREIPVVYQKVASPGTQVAAGTERVEIDDVTVVDGSGRSLPLQVTRGDYLRVRIGDPDRIVTGSQLYVISYRIARGVGFFPDHDELYWQVTGTESSVPILAATARVHLAVDSPGADGWAAWCYAGTSNSNRNDRCTATVDGPGAWHFGSGRLEPGEGLTLVASFPKGALTPPSAAQVARARFGWLWPLALPVVVFGLMFSHWRTRGRDPRPDSVVPAWTPPDGLRPGPAGTLWDQNANLNDVVATLVDLSVRGFVRIRETSPQSVLGQHPASSFVGRVLSTLGLSHIDWQLERVNVGGEAGLEPYEQLILAGLFGGESTVKMSDLHNEFYTKLPEIRSALYQTVVDQGLFDHNPQTQRTRYMLLGIAVSVAGGVAGVMVHNHILLIAGVLSGFIIAGFSAAMPARTVKGARQWNQLRGLEEYVRRAEALELELRQGPAHTTQLFEALLPYAIALRVSDIWAKQFGPILASHPPTWYVGQTPGQFNSTAFSSGLTDFQTAATRTLGSSPGSSSGGGGGGSVGGGGGGGGVGAW